MKKYAKILVLLLSVALVIGALTVIVGAADETVEYDYDLATAVANAEDGGKITLTGNAKVDSAITVDKNLTIDLGGYKVASTVATAFSITDSVKFEITGEGMITLDGELYRTASGKAPTVSVTGTSAVDVIDIIHTGSKSQHITYTYDGTYTFKNIDVVTSFGSSVTASSDISFFHNNSASTSVKVTFEGVEFDAPDAIPNNPGIFIISVAGSDSFLTIKNSYLHTGASGIYLGHLRASDVETDIVLIENSVISATPKQTYSQQQRNYGLYLEECGWKHTGTVGVIDIKDSFLESAGRTFYGSYEQQSKDKNGNVTARYDQWEVNQITSTINCYGSTIRAISSNTTDVGVYSFRFVNVNLDSSSRIGSPSTYVEQNSGGYAKGAVGTRINLASITTHTTRGIAFPDDMMGNGKSSEYTWIYDPAGDPEYPYVLAKVTKEGYVVGTDSEGNDIYSSAKAPYYYTNFNFESIYKITPPDTDASHYNLLGGRYENANNKKYFADTENFWGTMQLDIKAGSIYRGISSDNQYVKFVVTADAVSGLSPTTTTDGNGNVVTIKYGIDPYIILGGQQAYNTNKAFAGTGTLDTSSVLDKSGNQVAQTEVKYERAYVVVLDFDFGTDSAVGYPELNAQQQTRYAKSGTKLESELNSSDGVNIFSIAPNGTITPGASLTDAQSIALNSAGEWNHMTAVFYTDPAANDGMGIAYYYINGEYFGTSTVYRNGAVSFIQGMRFNISNTVQNVGASFAFDNVSFKAYNDYLYEGECDGSDSAAGVYSPESYLWITSPANKYITDAFKINGVAVDKDINSALADATAAETVLDLVRDIADPQKITTNGFLATNGYNIELDSDSYGFATTYDANGNAVYYFNEAYNQTVKYSFYIGDDYENHSDNLYADVEFKYGNIPYYDFVNRMVDFSSDGRTATAKLQNGWKTEDGKALTALTLDMIAATKDTGVKVYPVFEEQASPLVAYVKSTKTGSITAIAKANADAEKLYKTLGDDDTYVFLSDAIFDSTYYFYDDSVTETAEGVKYVNGVAIDNDYTDDEIAKMEEVAQHINVDLNGYTVYAKNRFACISNNTVYNIYSSAEGGTVCSLYTKSGATTLSGQRTLTIMDRTGHESEDKAKAVFNAHLNADNITVIGGFPVEGNSGDASCSLVIDNSTIIRAVNDSDGAIMCRFYYGELTVTNSIIAGPTANQLIDVRANGTGADACNPTLYFENCKFLNKGGRTDNVKTDGGAEVAGQKIITFVNCEFNGRNNPAANGNLFAGEGNAAAYLALTRYAETDLTKAYYNVGMTLGLDSHYLAVIKPVSDASQPTGFSISGYYYFVDYGYKAQFMADNPDVAESDIIELPLLTEKIIKKTDAITVTYENLDGTTQTQSYAPGGYIVPVTVNTSTNGTNVDIVATGSITSGALKITSDGTWAIPTEPVTEAVTVKAGGYTVAANISGIQANLSIYADFGINIYVPISYKSNITSANADDKELLITDVDLNNDGTDDHIKVTVTRAAMDAAKDVKMTLAISDLYEGLTYTTDATVTLNVASYAEKVLNLETATDADKTLMYQMLTYANAAIVYAGGTANEAITELIGENTVTDYSAAITDVCDTTVLAKAIAGATVDTDADLAYEFVTANGFRGTVTIVNGGITYNYTVTEDATVIRLSGMKVYNFAHDLVITAVGTDENGDVNVEGTYNLATFVKYHMNNAETSADSAKCVDFAKAFYNYVMEAASYVK